MFLEYKEAKVIGRTEGTILAICNMLMLGIPEEKVKEFYPDYFDEGKEIFNTGRVKGRAEGAILAVCNMLMLENPEEKVKELYPDYFDEGKKMFLEQTKN